MAEVAIEGVVVKPIVSHADERGFFRELIRCTDTGFDDGFGQLSHSLVRQGVLKAWHAHRIQYQWTYVVSGLLHVALYDTRSSSPTYRALMEQRVGDGQPVVVYGFPAGVAHGYRCIQGPAQVIYVTSGVYDLSDEVRIAQDDPTIGYDWVAAPERCGGKTE